MKKKPNIVFLFADQLRAGSLPLFGEHQIGTPNIDRLAAEGVTCTNAISPCPLCTPYRGALLTGRHPQTTGHVINFVTTRHDEIGIGDAFKRAGYRTGWVGKWHLHCGSWPAADMETGEGPFTFTSREVEGGYIVTGSAPLDKLVVKPGDSLGMVFSVSDMDNDNNHPAKHSWALKQAMMIPNEPVFVYWNDARTCGKVTLGK